MSTATLGDITLGYDDVGEGPALVFIHGHPFDRSMWRGQVAAFGRAGWRVIAPDLRGYGESTVVAGLTPLSEFAGDIARLLDHRGVDAIVLCGLSMGGQIAMEFQRLFPDRIRGLVLADTSAHAETEDGRARRREMADRLLREGMAGYAEEVLPRMLAPGTLRSMPDVAAHVLRMMWGTSPEGAAAALRGRAERPDYGELLGRIAVPALVVVGREDEFTPIRDARFLHERIPGSTLAIIDGAGHMPNLERPDEFDRALQALLDSVVAAAPGAAGRPARGALP